MPVDLFLIACSNAGGLDAAYARATEPDGTLGPDLTQKLANLVLADGRVSINIRQMDLLQFLNSGVYSNIWQWADGIERRSGKPVMETLRELLRTYFDQRIAFDDHFLRGREFLYGAVNIGGLGATTYGDHCMILRNALFDKGEEIAFLRNDSLKTYVAANLAIDDAQLTQESAPRSHYHLLCALKHRVELPGKPPAGWAAMVCSPSSYIEVVFIRSLGPANLEEVRMSQFDHDLYYHFAFESFSRPLSMLDKYLVKGFVMLLDRLEALGISLRTVSNA